MGHPSTMLACQGSENMKKKPEKHIQSQISAPTGLFGPLRHHDCFPLALKRVSIQMICIHFGNFIRFRLRFSIQYDFFSRHSLSGMTTRTIRPFCAQCSLAVCSSSTWHIPLHTVLFRLKFLPNGFFVSGNDFGLFFWSVYFLSAGFVRFLLSPHLVTNLELIVVFTCFYACFSFSLIQILIFVLFFWLYVSQSFLCFGTLFG
jgi:hypothetical protein